jgi:hypothetical protein
MNSYSKSGTSNAALLLCGIPTTLQEAFHGPEARAMFNIFNASRLIRLYRGRKLD